MASLWSTHDWAVRLAELQAASGDLKEVPLRRDVRSLGMLLGEVLREQAGPALFDAVESLRRTAIARREAGAAAEANGSEAPADARSHLQQALFSVHTAANDLPTAYQLARAFSFYFELINLAETNHRKRRRLANQLDPAAPPQRGSLRGALRHLRLAGISAPAAFALLERICISPVFTPHPTEGA